MTDPFKESRYCKNGHAIKGLVKVDARTKWNLRGLPLVNPYNPNEMYGLGIAQSGSMCSASICGFRDVNAWHDAAKYWIEKHFVALYRKYEAAVAAKQGGALSTDQKLAMEDAAKVMKDWRDFSSNWKEWTWKTSSGTGTHSWVATLIPGGSVMGLQNGLATHHWQARNEIRKIADLWNRAACSAEALESNLPQGVARQEPGSPGGPPAVPSPEDEPNQTFFQRMVGHEPIFGGSSGGKSAGSKFLTGAAIAGGGYLIYKVLTE